MIIFKIIISILPIKFEPWNWKKKKEMVNFEQMLEPQTHIKKKKKKKKKNHFKW